MKRTLEITFKSGKSASDVLKRYEQNLYKNIESVIKYTAKQMTNKARRKFQSAKYDGNNDTYVYNVKVTSLTNKSLCTYNIVAEGTSVLFIEFGAGHYYQDVYDRFANPLRETAVPKPCDIGTYGKGYGMDDYWVFKITTPIQKPTEGFESVWNTKTGTFREGVAWTNGNKPARAMWGAVSYYYKEFENNFKRGG